MRLSTLSILAYVLLGCATAPHEPVPAPASTPRPATSAEQQPEPGASELAPSHLCSGDARPEPCKNDVMRAGSVQETPPCLRILEPMASGQAKAERFEHALRERADDVWHCIVKKGADLSQTGKVMTIRVVAQPGQPALASFLASDLSPDAKRCIEQVVHSMKWPSDERSGEVTLSLVLVTRRWVDDPTGACNPK